ncbi:MAG: hypothetical protein J3K34DRAFT_438440 [Monoraphidium minutum]|nr:MAG: hypothetical protein J3K34DRAFT_438440 [Monoraphidium minutum]
MQSARPSASKAAAQRRSKRLIAGGGSGQGCRQSCARHRSHAPKPRLCQRSKCANAGGGAGAGAGQLQPCAADESGPSPPGARHVNADVDSRHLDARRAGVLVDGDGDPQSVDDRGAVAGGNLCAGRVHVGDIAVDADISARRLDGRLHELPVARRCS